FFFTIRNLTSTSTYLSSNLTDEFSFLCTILHRHPPNHLREASNPRSRPCELRMPSLELGRISKGYGNQSFLSTMEIEGRSWKPAL
ncbi:hypothetical protein A2U01_0029986, partial [Trifolium medium]|nr:hypothetical protein [Trifolium medium]